MHQKLVSILMSLICCAISANSQINIEDTMTQVLLSGKQDTVKIDQLNQYIIQYSPSNPEKMLAFADSAILLSRKINDSVRLAGSLNRKGNIYYFLGDYNGSLEQYFYAVKIKEASGQNNTIWREYNNIGLVLRKQEQNEEALKFFDVSLKQIKPSDKKYIAILYNNIGICYRGMKNYSMARYYIEKAKEINLQIGEKQSLAHNLNNLGVISFNQNQKETAVAFYNSALEINISLQNNYETLQVLNNLAELYITDNNYARANSYLEKASLILSEIKADNLKLEFLKLKSACYKLRKDYKNALIFSEKYAAMRDSIFTADKITQFEQLKTLANAEKEIQKVEFLERINRIQSDKIRIQRLIEMAGGFIIILISLLLFFLFRNLKINKKLNQNLTQKSEELSNLNEELKSANEELKSEQHELELTLNKLQETQNHLMHSEKMASIGILASGIAHEINNPLNFIQGGIEGIESYITDNLKMHHEALNPLISAIQSGVSRAESIVTSLNLFSKPSSNEKTICNVKTIIESVLVNLQNLTSNKIQYIKTLDEKPLLISANYGKIQQALLNIITNSIQAIKNEGVIKITCKQDGKTIKITVEDNGSGIKDEDRNKIFDPFFTTKEPGKGTGLGLSITYNIITEIGGTIEVYSVPGKGTSFIIFVPVMDDLNYK